MRSQRSCTTIVFACCLLFMGFLTAPQLQAKINTATKLTSSLNPSTYGQAVIFTATVTPASGSGTPTGTVTFSDGVHQTTVTMSGGIAKFTTASLTAGTHSITATYSGDSNYNGSASSPVSQKVNRAPTTTALTSSPNPSGFAQQVIFTATITGKFGGTPTGSVSFTYVSTPLCTNVALSGAIANCQYSSLPVGADLITAVYSGDANFLASSGTETQTVNEDSTTTTLSSSPNPSGYLQTVTFTATVAPAPDGGQVTFNFGSTLLCTVTPTNGVATCPYANLPVGSDSVTATYGGDTNYKASTSNTVVQVVNAVLTSISVSPQNLSVALGSAPQPYSAEGFYNDGSQKDITNTVSWTSTNTSVATVSTGGVESPVAAGTTSIGATQGAIQGSAGLTVDAANTFFVATNGNDAWSGIISAPNSGNTDGPFASPSRAQYAVEQATKPATVMLRNGTYYLALTPSVSTPYITNPGTLRLTSADSGSSATSQVTWQNYPNETPVISGGVPANSDPNSGVGLHLSWNAAGSLYTATLPATLSNNVALQNFEYLFYNGQRRLRSRVHDTLYPSVGYFMSNDTCTAIPGWPAGEFQTTLSSCNLGSFLRVANTIAPSDPLGTNCPSATASDGVTQKCLDRFIYAPTSGTGSDLIQNWSNLTFSPQTPNQPCNQTTAYPPGDVALTMFDAWTVEVMRVNCVDTSKNVIYLTGPTKAGNGDNYNFFGPTINHRFLIENAYEPFNLARNNRQTGIWFLDRRVKNAWVLNYIAETGENPPTDNIVIPQLPQLSTPFPTGGQFPLLNGTQELPDYTGGSLIWATNLSYVTFTGITFEIDNFYPSLTGFNNDGNGEYSVPQAIDCESCQNDTFNEITVRHTSGSSILIASPGATGPVATADTIEYSVFYDIGDSGIRIGKTPSTKPGSQDNALYVVNNVSVHDNLIKGYSRVFADGEGIAVGNGNSNTFVNNTVTDGYHAGISVCFNGCGPTDSNNNNVNGNGIISQYNLLSNLMQGITSDGGSLYYNVGSATSSATGNIIESNVVYDTTDSFIIDVVNGVKANGTGYGGEGIYLDAQTANVNVKNNVVYNVNGNAIHLTEGVAWNAKNAQNNEQPNSFTNNIFAFSDLGMFSQGKPWIQGCPPSGTSVTEVNVHNNIFNFDKPNNNNASFEVVQGCNNACGEPYSTYQNFVNNAYYNTVSDFSLDPDAFRVLETQGPAGLNPNQGNACFVSPYFPLTLGNSICSWQTGTDGTVCIDNRGKSNPLQVTMDEDTTGEIFNSKFPATGKSTDLPTFYSFSDNGLTGPPNFTTGLTDDAINFAGRCTKTQPPQGCLADPAPSGVPPTFPTYVYTSF